MVHGLWLRISEVTCEYTKRELVAGLIAIVSNRDITLYSLWLKVLNVREKLAKWCCTVNP